MMKLTIPKPSLSLPPPPSPSPSTDVHVVSVLCSSLSLPSNQMSTLDKLSVLDECLLKMSQKKSAPPDRGLYVIDTIVLPF